MNMPPLTDAKQRQQALDATQSFIVQAPAGSGKTELLVQRYLLLLTRVQNPEAIIAITFTRKAANEMRLRIIHSLEMAHSEIPVAAKDVPRYQLAKKVLAQDQRCTWNLLANPNRLRIMTIDSFCHSLTRQMPLLSSFGKKLSPVDNPEWLYQLAVQELLTHLEDELPWQKTLVHLLSHLDNNFQLVEKLLIDMLARREQWLNYLVNHQHHLRRHLEQGLQAINQACVTALNQLMPADLRQQLYHLLNFSLSQLSKKSLENSDDLNFWQAATILLLTKDNAWRKQFRKTEGFPVVDELKNKAEKQQYSACKKLALELIRRLSQTDRMLESLVALKNAPPLYYTDGQWQTLNNLFELLPVLVAHLKIIFQQQQKCDYTEILLAALTALGQPENPSDLALRLDYQIEHLLVDEFQDTSSSQLQLIEKLTAGWQPEDGRSLFLVGDPMQSIYRFRKAEVGLFLQVQQCGIGAIQLRPLTLSVNFRSNRDIIDWINDSFAKLLPATEDIHCGAIAYSPANAYSSLNSRDAISQYWQLTNDPLTANQVEATKIIEIIQQINRQDPQSTIAILVRARSHLTALLPALNAAAIPYQAIEIDSLAEKSVVQDLLALTRALNHLGDRISWLALLRAPYCGLSLPDLYQITQFSDENHLPITIWQQLIHFEAMALSENCKQRLRRIVPILQHSLNQHGRLPLAKWIKTTWLNLGGPSCLQHYQEINHVDAFLNFLENKITDEGPIDFFKSADELAKNYAQNPAQPGYAVEIMTIHKAKGLEYDHIILPGLHRKGSPDPPQLLLYREKFHTPHKKDFLLAPIKASDEDHDLIYNYLFKEETKKSNYELTRLLYVACTRAKKSLHLLATLSEDEKAQLKKPSSQSLLSHLWPIVKINRDEILLNRILSASVTSPLHRLLKRLPADWQTPITRKVLELSTTPSCTYQWALHPARAIGTVIHRLLYQISQDGLAHWNRKKISTAQAMFAQLLAKNGLLASQVEKALVKITMCLEKTLADPRGRWILNSQHRAAQSEFAVTAVLNGQIKSLIIDRTFIDRDTGIRWIIDYKTTAYAGDNPQEFLSTETQHYKAQLETYARALLLDANLSGAQTIRLGLYFPMNSLWCEWAFSETATESISS